MLGWWTIGILEQEAIQVNLLHVGLNILLEMSSMMMVL